MPEILKADAEAIARKLRAVYKQGRKHTIAEIWHKERFITQFGIRHDRTANHAYIPQQIYMSMKDCITFRECKIEYEEWVERARVAGHIPASDPEPPQPPKRHPTKRHG